MPAVDFYLVSAARRAHRLRPGRIYVFGREETVDIVLQDALASRRHAELRWNDAPPGWTLVDLGSRNGVMVDGQRLAAPMALCDGMQIQIGGSVFRLHLLPPGGDPASLSTQAPQISSLETMGPGMSLQELATQGATYTGTVEGGILELLQFFHVTAKTGRLDLICDTAQAPSSVWMAQGTPVHAVAQRPSSPGSAIGIDAVIELATHPPQRFAFHGDAPSAPTRSITASAQGVFMEVARVLDEAQRG